MLSEQDRFAVYRLIEKTEEAWTVQAAIFPKRDFESWFRNATATRHRHASARSGKLYGTGMR